LACYSSGKIFWPLKWYTDRKFFGDGGGGGLICSPKNFFGSGRAQSEKVGQISFRPPNFFLPVRPCSSSFQSSRKLSLSSGNQCCVKSSVAIICCKGSSSLQSNINRCRCSGVQESERFAVNPCCSFSIPHSSKRLIIPTFSSS
jgi:hypothetical protein